MSKEKKPGFWQKYAHRKISESVKVQKGNNLFLLSEQELRLLEKNRKSTYFKAGMAGVLGVLLLYIPYHVFGDSLFKTHDVWIPYYEDYLALEISFLLYSVVLVFAEIWYLTFLNIQAVSEISHICGHPNSTDKNYESNLNALIHVGLEKKQKQLKGIGINPHNGLSKIGLIIFQIAIKLKAAASNILFKLLVKKVLGRYALRFVLDFAGIPVYAFWNIWGSHKVMNEARIRVMAPPLIQRCVDQVYEDQVDNPEFRYYIYDTLQLISQSKRAFHYNHFLLAVCLLERFEIEIKREPQHNPNFLDEIPKQSERTINGIEKLLLFGIIIDGKISFREKRAIRFLIEKGVIQKPEKTVLGWSKDYFEGKGIDNLLSENNL